MKILSKLFPKRELVNTPEEDRRATWLELFYDTVYVAAFFMLTHSFEEHINLKGVLIFCLLLTAIYWTWSRHMIFANIFESDGWYYRFFTLFQMAGVGIMAVYIPKAFEETLNPFLIGFLWYKIGTFMQATRIYMVEFFHKKTLKGKKRKIFYRTFLFSGTLFYFLSLFTTENLTYVVFGLGLIIDFLIPIVYHYKSKSNQKVNHTISYSHLGERQSLLTIIILGEAVLGLITNYPENRYDFLTLMIVFFSFSLIGGMWWSYFYVIDKILPENGKISCKAVKNDMRSPWYIYMHLILYFGIILLDVGLVGILIHGCHEMKDLLFIIGGFVIFVCTILYAKKTYIKTREI